MFGFIRRLRIKRYTRDVLNYIKIFYIDESSIRRPTNQPPKLQVEKSTCEPQVKFSISEEPIAQPKPSSAAKPDQRAEVVKHEISEEPIAQPKPSSSAKPDQRAETVKHDIAEDPIDPPTKSQTEDLPKKPYEIQPSILNRYFDRYDYGSVSQVMKQRLDQNVIEVIRELERVRNMTFVDAIISYIDKRGLRDSDVYKAANIDRRLFSKMMSDRNYKPSKDTAISIAIGLRLNIDQTTDLLSRAGYVLSHSNQRDIVIEYFIKERVYKIYDINDVLYAIGQKVIGG